MRMVLILVLIGYMSDLDSDKGGGKNPKLLRTSYENGPLRDGGRGGGWLPTVALGMGSGAGGEGR